MKTIWKEWKNRKYKNLKIKDLQTTLMKVETLRVMEKDENKIVRINKVKE